MDPNGFSEDVLTILPSFFLDSLTCTDLYVAKLSNCIKTGSLKSETPLPKFFLDFLLFFLKDKTEMRNLVKHAKLHNPLSVKCFS